MKKILSLFLLIPAFCLFLSSAKAEDYKQEYKLSVVPGASSGWGKSASHFADLVMHPLSVADGKDSGIYSAGYPDCGSGRDCGPISCGLSSSSS